MTSPPPRRIGNPRLNAWVALVVVGLAHAALLWGFNTALSNPKPIQASTAGLQGWQISAISAQPGQPHKTTPATGPQPASQTAVESASSHSPALLFAASHIPNTGATQPALMQADPATSDDKSWALEPQTPATDTATSSRHSATASALAASSASMALGQAHGDFAAAQGDSSQAALVASLAQPPSSLTNPPPPYPPMSRWLGEQGTVLVQAFVDENGRVQKAILRASSGFDRLDQAALQSVARWRFASARSTAQAEWVDVPVRFELR
jgi:protein TonB